MVAGEMHNTGLFFSKSVLLLFLLYPPHNDETFFFLLGTCEQKAMSSVSQRCED